MSISRLRRTRRNRKTNASRHHLQNVESLEDRRLMAADAFNFETIEDPVVTAYSVEMYETVDDLATMVQTQIPEQLFQQALEQDRPDLLLDQIHPEQFQPIVDSAEIPNLGPTIGQNPVLHAALTDMVLLDLMGVPDQAPEYVDQMNLFLNELNCELDFVGGDSTGDRDQLPPQFEQLRLELGDESFAEWLHNNQLQTGTLSGVPMEAVEQLDGAALRQLEATEAALDLWLRDQQQPVVFDLPGDTDGNNEVDFSDFLTLSSHFGTTVDTGYLAGDFDLDGTVAFSDFLVLSSNFGTTTTTVGCDCDTSDANNPDGATKIQGAGELTIRNGSIVFVSDKTVSGDAGELKKDAPDGTPIHTGMKSWQDIVDKIKDMPDGSITGDLVISGHGAEGGIWASGSDIDGEDITKEQAEILKKKLGKGARIVVLGCCQANKDTDEHMQRLADLTGASVVGNQGAVNNGANGSDDWFEFKPKAN